MGATIRQQLSEWIHSDSAHHYWLRDGPQWNDTSFQQLVEAVDSSHFSVDDWLRALIEMELWLEHKNLALKREARVAYIECAASVADNLSDLATVVRDFLEAYGCEQAT